MSVGSATLLTAARDLLDRPGRDDCRHLAARDGARHPPGAGAHPRRSLATPRARDRAVLARAQLLCLPSYLRGNEALAEDVAYAWSSLSRACHQHAYELLPTSAEPVAWVDVAERFAAFTVTGMDVAGRRGETNGR